MSNFVHWDNQLINLDNVEYIIENPLYLNRVLVGLISGNELQIKYPMSSILKTRKVMENE